MAAAPIGDRVRVVWFRQSRCDFCDSPLAGTAYARFACRNFVHDLGERCELPMTLLGYWAACAGCAYRITTALALIWVAENMIAR